MARLLLFLLSATLLIAVAMAMKSCSNADDAPSDLSGSEGGTGLVALHDGSTMMAQPGTVGRDLVDWLAARRAGQKAFELGGQEFVGRTATPTAESIGRVPRLIAMLRANPDVRVTVIGHAAPSGNEQADRALGAARAEMLARLLREGGVSPDRISTDSKGSAVPLTSSATAVGRARNQRVSLILSRNE